MIFESDGFSFALLGSLPTWDQRLNKSELFVLRHHGTEPAFSAEYEKKPAAGYYVCRACGSRLFDASDQFDARCGWPAFWQPSNGDQVKLIEDNSLGMRRVEVRCSACDSHLGHVFHGEGFGFPTDDRYCINAICLERRY
jgi:peptide-methionine (R)-S-oxide reductase